jgi:Cys-tRNA(Pro)/Cys-tRNA(Cys) deacylase
MKTALDLHRELLSRDIPHEIVRLPYAVSSVADLPDALGVPADQCMAVRVFVADDRLVAFGLGVGRQPQLDSLLLAADCLTLRMATGQEVSAATDFPAGLVPPLPLPPGMPLFVDAQLGQHDVLYTASGEQGTALGIRTAELLVASRARVAPLTTPSLADLVLDLEV